MLSTDELLQDLTEPQREAATHVDGPMLIIAGAGSGKTRVITRRVAYLVSQGIPASSILAITFTNKAAGEMKSRISAALDRPIHDFAKLDQRWPTICTFHSLCLRILRHYATKVGLPDNFSIFDSGDQNKLIKEAVKALDLSSTNFSPNAVHATISNAKNQLIGAEAFAQNATDFYQKTIARIYLKYQKALKANNALDFDDLLLLTAEAFRAHPDMLSELQDRFQYILIDEYQDTNHAQYVIAHALAMRHRNMCVVGDPDQSIYAWRGADLRNILDFEKDYTDAKVVRLEQNYRSTQRILEIASALISHNTERKKKSLWTENEQGEKSKLLLCQDEHDEAAQIARQLAELHEKQKQPWSGMAVFYRINALSRVMEDALRRANIPYQIARGVAFYSRKEIKDVLAYLRLIANPLDEVSLTRIVNVPTRGLGDAGIKRMQAHAIASGMSLWDVLQRATEAPGLSTRAIGAATQFVGLVKSWRRMAGVGAEGGAGVVGDKCTIQKLMEDVVKRSGMEAMLRKIGEKELEELSNVEELVSSAAEYDRESPEASLVDYLAQVSLVSDADHMKGGDGAVTMMTLHAAKGLEFPVVAMIGLEEGVLPHSRAQGNLREMEEERRLCFVGITRARKWLVMSKAAYRTIRGMRERTVTSPFLGEMPEESLVVEDRTGAGGYVISKTSEKGSAQFRGGQVVRHPSFGTGRIVELSHMGAQTRAIVQFNTAGRKTLILEYARLEAVKE